MERTEKSLVGWNFGREFIYPSGVDSLLLRVLSRVYRHIFSLFPLPDSIARPIETMRRDFLLGGMGDELKFHLVNWMIVCTPIR